MSRIGKKPITVPAGITPSIADKQLTVKGPKGTLTMPLRDEISYTLEDGSGPWCRTWSPACRKASPRSC
jgi:large subunit ribosomal protein L6